MERINTRTLREATECLRLGDTLFIPQTVMPFAEKRKIGAWLANQSWFRSLFPGLVTEDRDKTPAAMPSFFFQLLSSHYSTVCGGPDGREPDWFAKLDNNTIRELRREAAIIGEYLEPLAVVPAMPYAGLGYIILEDGLAEKTILTFRLARLAGIRQLGFLHDPVVRSIDQSKAMGDIFLHTRYCHSLDVYAIALLIARNNGLSQADEDHLRIAALTHDALTPAGGDTIKLVAPTELDEETNYGFLFERFDWHELEVHYSLSAKRLDEIVHNQGILGQILDLADKLAYVARDTAMFLGRARIHNAGEYKEKFQQMVSLTEKRPLICALWEQTTIENSQLVLEDPEHVADFLKLRAMCFRNLYYAPEARFLEHLLAKTVVQYLFDTGQLSVAELLSMRDLELENRINAMMGSFFCDLAIGRGLQAYVEQFKRPQEAAQREKTLVKKGALTLIDHFQGNSGSGTNFLVRHNGQIKTFAKARPDSTAEIVSIMSETKPVRLYYLWLNDMEPGSKAGIRKVFDHHKKRVLSHK